MRIASPFVSQAVSRLLGSQKDAMPNTICPVRLNQKHIPELKNMSAAWADSGFLKRTRAWPMGSLVLESRTTLTLSISPKREKKMLTWLSPGISMVSVLTGGRLRA